MQLEDLQEVWKRLPWLWAILQKWTAAIISLSETSASEEKFGKKIEDSKMQVWVKLRAPDRVVRIPTQKIPLGRLLAESPAGRSNDLQFVCLVRRWGTKGATEITIYSAPIDRTRFKNFAEFITRSGQPTLTLST